MQSPTKKRAGGDDLWPGRGKRLATTPPRLTRSMLKKLNQNGGPPVELNPGLDMGVRRRGPRARPPKRAAQDEAVGASVKRTSTTRGRGPGTKPTEPQHNEAQSQESPLTVSHLTDQERRGSEADAAAASRLAQAAMAAGLAGKNSESGSPVAEHLPSLVRFTKKDLRNILSEAVVDIGTRSKIEPHWLARTEFLTWWERPAADMDHIKEEVRRLAVRWSNDLETQHADDADIPISMLESWRANIVIAGVSREDAGDREAMNQAGNEKIGDENDKSEIEVNKKEGKIEGGGKQGAKDQADKEKEGNEQALAYDSREVAEALAESVTLTERDMAEWKEAFDQEMAAEPNFRSKRAWTARVSESQKGAKTLEEQVRKLEVYKSEWVAKSTMQAADHLLDELQKFRVELRMDRKAFWDEFDQEGSELLLRDTEAEQNTEDEVQEEAQQDEAQEIGVGGENSQMATSEAEKDDAQMTGIEEHKGSNTGDGGVSEAGPGSTGHLSEVANDYDDSGPTIARPEHAAEERPIRETSASAQGEEPSPPLPARIIDDENKNGAPGARQRRAAETYAGEGTSPLREQEEEKFEAVPASELEQQDQSREAAEIAQKTNSPEPTPWLPDKRGSHSPSWKWPGHQQERHDDITSGANAAVEEREQPSHEVGRDTISAPFGRRSVTAEEVSDEEESRVDQAVATSNMASVPQHVGSKASVVEQPHIVDVMGREIKVSRDQILTAPGMTRPAQDTSSLASSSRPASPGIITGGVENTADSSSTASNISSLPDDTGSPTPGRAASVGGVQVQDTVGSTSPTSNIARLLQEASLPQDTSLSTPGIRLGGVEGTDSEPKQTTDQASTTSLPQDTSPTTSGIRTGSDAGIGGGENESTVDDHARSTSDAGALPQGSAAGGETDSPPAVSIGQSPIVVPNMRYIRPQWESFAGLEEPTYGANDYSANEVDDDDDEEEDEDETDEVDYWGVDDVDP